MDREKSKRIITLIVVPTAIVAVALVAFLVHLIMDSINPYGEQIVIDNFSTYFADAPKDTRDAMFARLYDAILENNGNNAEAIPESGALIREGSASNIYSESENIHQGKFIVDIAAVGQSYSGYFQWSNNENNMYLTGYATLYTCLPASQLVYGDFGCVDMFSDDITTLYPITTVLPVAVDYYSDNYTSYTKYDIKYEIIDDAVTLKITDYSGGSYEKALAKIRELGYNPEDYNIVYDDQSGQDAWPYVGD